MKVLIIEDEAPASKQLTKMLKKADPSITIIETIDSVEASVKWLNTFPSPDAIFMDIQIADGLSFDIFNHVDINCPVVFTTAFDQYAIKAFRVNALDYLLKPIDEDELNDVILKLKQQKGTSREGGTSYQYNADFLQNLNSKFIKTNAFKTRFLIKQGTSLNFVETQDIAYFFSEDGLTHFYSIQNKKHLIEPTLDELEHQLNPSDYFRINRKIIVSIKSIKKISPHFNSRLKLELNPHYLEEIFVARERVSDFKTWLGG